LRILVIDDHPPFADALRRMLEHDGHRVRIVLGGREGLNTVRMTRDSGEEFDVIMADYSMPDADGLKIAATVKETVPSPPVVLITAYAVDASDMLPAHVDAMMAKPPDLHELRAILSRVTTRPASNSSDAHREKERGQEPPSRSE